jgi:DNA-directed RNA polymerase subunit H (RpoH/RPB5)
MSELSNIEMKNTELISTVLLNIGKLFNRRGYSDIPDDIIKEIYTNKMANFKLGTKKISINIMNQDIKNISSNSPIDEYLSNNIDYHKFLIVKYFAKKTYKQINSDYKNTEIFSIYELLEDIPSKLFIPTHTLIVDKDREELLKTFTLKEFGRIYSTDMMARYYGAKINDIFRIERPNINSGISIYYRIVVPGSLEIFV